MIFDAVDGPYRCLSPIHPAERDAHGENLRERDAGFYSEYRDATQTGGIQPWLNLSNVMKEKGLGCAFPPRDSHHFTLSRAKATPHLVPLRMMAELRFVGDPALVCDLLPAVLALDPAANSFLVGRQGQKGRESVCARALAELSDPILQCRTAALCWTRKRRG